VAGCLALAVLRDTRALFLDDADRINYFPAAPLVTVTIVLQGHLHVAPGLCDLETIRARPPVSGMFLRGPQPQPIMSWSPGPIVALTLAFYPDAWVKLEGVLDPLMLPPPVQVGMGLFKDAETLETAWAVFCRGLHPVWSGAALPDQAVPTAPHPRLSDWIRRLAVRAAFSGPGRSARALERRFKRWTGQSRQTLEFFAQVEALHRLTLQSPDATAAQIAQDGAFSDQSHMGRAVKRATGFSPVDLNRRIASEEAFWCYRLLGERF
jgi:AraC-like DNA-binding protein